MYIGTDFLIEGGSKLFLSEINTGVPAGATEFDLVYRQKYGKPSGVFGSIEGLAKKIHGKSFKQYIQDLPYIDDLSRLKIWMDGKGAIPKNPHKALILEDKWIQYKLFSEDYPMIPSQIFNVEDTGKYENLFLDGGRVVLKRRYGRGGKGFLEIDSPALLRTLRLEKDLYLIQPYVKSRIDSYSFSLRAAAFEGRFICTFASLSSRCTSNHGIRFFVEPRDGLYLTNSRFKVSEVIQKAWEADIFFKGNVPDYLYQDVYVEKIADASLVIPERLFNDIKRISASLSGHLDALDLDKLPRSCLESNPVLAD